MGRSGRHIYSAATEAAEMAVTDDDNAIEEASIIRTDSVVIDSASGNGVWDNAIWGGGPMKRFLPEAQQKKTSIMPSHLLTVAYALNSLISAGTRIMTTFRATSVTLTVCEAFNGMRRTTNCLIKTTGSETQL